MGTMRSDMTKLRQSLFNLLSNASKFTESGITLTVERRESDWITFSVSVSIGMTPEQQASYFRRLLKRMSLLRANMGERDWDS